METKLNWALLDKLDYLIAYKGIQAIIECDITYEGEHYYCNMHANKYDEKEFIKDKKTFIKDYRKIQNSVKWELTSKENIIAKTREIEKKELPMERTLWHGERNNEKFGLWVSAECNKYYMVMQVGDIVWIVGAVGDEQGFVLTNNFWWTDYGPLVIDNSIFTEIIEKDKLIDIIFDNIISSRLTTLL